MDQPLIRLIRRRKEKLLRRGIQPRFLVLGHAFYSQLWWENDAQPEDGNMTEHDGLTVVVIPHYPKVDVLPAPGDYFDMLPIYEEIEGERLIGEEVEGED